MKKKILIAALLVTIIILLVSNVFVAYSVPNGDKEFAETFVDLLCKNDYTQIEPYFDAKAKDSYPSKEIEIVSKVLNRVKTKDIVEYSNSRDKDRKISTLTYRLQMKDDEFINRNKPLFLVIDIDKTTNSKKITGLRFRIKQ